MSGADTADPGPRTSIRLRVQRLDQLFHTLDPLLDHLDQAKATPAAQKN